MSSQINFLLDQALHFLRSGNLESAELLLKQIIKTKENHSEALRILGIVAAQKNNHQLALDRFEESIAANKRNAITYSNKGNVLLELGRPIEAIQAHRLAISLLPSYAEAHSNLGNAFQNIEDFRQAIDSYLRAIKLDPNNLSFKLNLGNAYSRSGLYDKAIEAYLEVIKQNPSNADAHFYLAQIQLLLEDFDGGWNEYEWRWLSQLNNSQPLSSSRPIWQGQSFDGCLFIWAEQGIGDQVLHASMLSELIRFPQKKLVSVDGKLLPIFQRSFPGFEFIDKTTIVSEDRYDQHLPIASLGKFFRRNRNDFSGSGNNYLISSKTKIQSNQLNKKMLCGISWKSSNKLLGSHKSVDLIYLSQILKLKDLDFINLQYGDISSEIESAQSSCDIIINRHPKVDLYNDIDGVLSLIDACDIVLTTSNSVAHLAGAIGKEVLLLVPYSLGKFWYWHDVDGVSLWYPSIKVFKQENPGDWSAPIEAVKAYLEKRLEI